MTNREFLPTVYSFIDKRKKTIKSLEKSSKSQGMSNEIDYLIRRNDTDLAIWQKIQQMIESDSTVLNISNLNSSFIPMQMFDLELTELNLDNNELFELPLQIEKLKKLRKLSVNGNGSLSVIGLRSGGGSFFH